MATDQAQLFEAPVQERKHDLGRHWDDLSDFKLTLRIIGEPFVLKNSKVVTTVIVPAKAVKPRQKRCPICRKPVHVIPKVLPSVRAKEFLERATAQLAAQWRKWFKVPIPPDVMLNAAIVTYLPTRRLADASNLYQAPEDALQAAGVITNDVQIASHDGSRRLYDPQNPRVEITLTPYLE